MTTISNATSTAATTGTNNTPPSSSFIGGTSAAQLQHEFLSLLVAQLKNQDPSSPMDNSQMVSQMAQLSQVEAASNLNTEMKTGFQMDSMLQAANKIGSKVLAPGSVLQLTNGSASLGVNLSGDADNVSVAIQDSSGNTIDTINMGAQSGGMIPLSWDGKTSAGTTAPDGTYKFNVTATQKNNTVAATTLSVGTLQAVSNGASGIQASVAGIGALDSAGKPTSVNIALSSIQQFI